MEEKTWVTKSSGEQQDFGTGAKRDTQQGKGRFDLIPIHALMLVAQKYGEFGKSLTGKSSRNIGDAISCLYSSLDKDNPDATDDAATAVWYILEYMEYDGRFYEELPKVDYDLSVDGEARSDLIPYSSLKRVADVYERGANLYGERNWENGMPLSRLLDSSIRHLFQAVAGKDDEDHAAQGAWNAIGFVETLWRIKKGYLPEKLDNRPSLKKEKDLLDFDGEEVVEKPGGFQAALGRALHDGYGGDFKGPVTKPKFTDGYGFQFDEGAFDFSDEAEERKTLFGSIIGSPQPLSTFVGRSVVVDNQSGKIAQLTFLTPPDVGIAVDIRLDDGKCVGKTYNAISDLEAELV
jgi:hypothetical protein